ncbi:MAG: TetR/AcrR family transcriptional regulator [Thermoanaerobaculia bacterium]
MLQEERSERSRRQILDSALILFSHQGYRATSVREIAEAAAVSTGNVYHHFPDKETIFRELLDEYWSAIAQPDFPLNAALARGEFPDNLEIVGFASRESVSRYRKYVALIYVDVVEFDGSHIRKFYSEMWKRYEAFLAQDGRRQKIEKKLRSGISPVSALMLATRFYLNYFSVEILFGVKDHFGKDSESVIREIADMLRNGMLRVDKPKRSRPASRKTSSTSVRRRKV